MKTRSSAALSWRLFSPVFAAFSPPVFCVWAKKAYPYTLLLCLLFATIGLGAGLFYAPIDAQQGEAYRVIYVHVPCAVFSLAVYLAMAVAAMSYLTWQLKVADAFLRASASLGLLWTTLALLTGAIWGKPMWGTAWVWDARLTAELILFFLYIGYTVLRQAITHPKRAATATSLLILIGSVDLPIIHYSVTWWHTLHQGPTVLRWGAPHMASSMLWPLLLCGLAAGFYSLSVWLLRTPYFLCEQAPQARWAQSWRNTGKEKKATC